jgi:hypothetical protein
MKVIYMRSEMEFMSKNALLRRCLPFLSLYLRQDEPQPRQLPEKVTLINEKRTQKVIADAI